LTDVMLGHSEKHDSPINSRGEGISIDFNPLRENADLSNRDNFASSSNVTNLRRTHLKKTALAHDFNR
jgi:hypothetical protein